jgi:hypothetical protein
MKIWDILHNSKYCEIKHPLTFVTCDGPVWIILSNSKYYFRMQNNKCKYLLEHCQTSINMLQNYV